MLSTVEKKVQYPSGKFPSHKDTTVVLKLQATAGNKIYHVDFSNFGGTEDVVSATKIKEFEAFFGNE